MKFALGLIGQFWRPGGNLQQITPAAFKPFHENGFCKAVWTFTLAETKANTTRVETDTRIYCTDKESLRKSSRYWFFIRPFSGLVRIEILRSIKNKAEQS